jgi:hypothetical protein
MTIHTDPNAAHAVYAPSSASRWVYCTASAEAIGYLPEQEEGEEAKEGTAAHEELERVLSGGAIDPEHDAAFAVALAVSYVRQLSPGQMWIEQRVALTDQIWGRCDVAHWDDSTSVLTIVDLKNGMRAVDVEENEQLRIYAAASMFTHKLPVKWIRYAVVQPNDWRPFVPRVKQWHEPVADLYEWAGRVAAIPKATKSFTVGDHCRDCPLFGKCDASIDMLSNFGAVIAALVAPDSVRADQVALFLALEKPITDQIKKFKTHWEKAALKSDAPPPGMKLVTTNPHRAWKDVAAARAAVIAKCGVDALEPPTPAQAEELGVDVSELAAKPKGGPALAFANDKRKPWAPVTAQEMFANVPGVTPK